MDILKVSLNWRERFYKFEVINRECLVKDSCFMFTFILHLQLPVLYRFFLLGKRRDSLSHCGNIYLCIRRN